MLDPIHLRCVHRTLVVACAAVTSVLALTVPVARASALSVNATPSTVTAGETLRLGVTGQRSTTCVLSVRGAQDGSHITVRRRIGRRTRLTIPTRAAAGVRVVIVRCGRQRASTRFTIVPRPDRTLSEPEPELGRLPVDPADVESYSVADGVGGAGFSTRVPFARGSAIRVTQSPGGGFSHSGAYTRNAIDLAAPAGTAVLAGFSGVVAAARGGCAPARSWGCNSGWGNFVLLRNADGTCAIHAHLTAINVAVGQPLARYVQVGTVGSSGSSTGPHLHYDRLVCATQISLPWSFEEAGVPPAGAIITSGNEPPPANAAPTPAPPVATTPPGPARIVLTVDNRVTNGTSMREDSSPARLTTKPWIYCGSRGCNIAGTERGTGGQYDAAVCTTFGERTTNGNDSSTADDGNPLRYESTRYYGVRLGNGTFGFISEVWIQGAQRGGMGLPAC